MVENMTIAEVRENQLESLFAIHELCFKDHIEEIWGWDEEWQWDYFLKEWKSSEWRVLLKDEMIIGYLVWMMNEDHLYLKNIAFIPEYRRQGLGKQAMSYISKEARKHNYPVWLSTFRTNQEVIKFYEKLGFRTTEEKETGVRMCLECLSNGK